MEGYLLSLIDGRHIFYDVADFPMNDDFIELDLDKAYTVVFPRDKRTGEISYQVQSLKKSPLDFTKFYIAKHSLTSITQLGDNSILKNEIIKAKTNLYMAKNIPQGAAFSQEARPL